MVPFKYATFASERAMDLYIEFMNIPDNRLSFEVPNDYIITSDMMETMILAAYHAKGEGVNVTS